MYKLDINFSIVIILLLTVVVSFICLKLKISSLQDKIKKLQKHLIYFNDMIEKHSEKLKTVSSSTNSDALTATSTGDSKKSELMEDFDLDIDIDEKKDQQVTNSQSESNSTTTNTTTTSRTNSSPLTNILPLVSTVMTMMNTPPSPSVNHHMEHMDSPIIEDVTESPGDKNMLLDEIQEELKDLDSSVTEKRELST